MNSAIRQKKKNDPRRNFGRHSLKSGISKNVVNPSATSGGPGVYQMTGLSLVLCILFNSDISSVSK